MHDQTYTLTEAKAKFSEIINRVHFRHEKFTITKKGKAVAVVLPVDELQSDEKGEGLIRAQGVLSGMDDAIDDLLCDIYDVRNKETGRKVDI